MSREALARFHAGTRCEVIRVFAGLGGLQVVQAPKGGVLDNLLCSYQESGLAEYVEPDTCVRLAGVFPNDPRFLDGTQWGLNNAGQNGGQPNADIDAPEGWAARTSASNVVVAVVDSGIRLTHEDLASNLWTNPLDGTHGFNALNVSADPEDDNGHGTRLAGIIGAAGNNGLGIAGVAWRLQLMACKFADQYGNGTISDAIACLEFARSNGTHIVNASWGTYTSSLSLSNAFDQLRADGVLVVAAAGNDEQDLDVFPYYPAAFELDNILAVAATTRRDELYWLSSFGSSSVDLAGPGNEIYSTDSASDSAYALDEGTSMAAAYTCGAAALLRAAYPTDTPAQTIARLISTVDPLPALAGKCVSGGRLNLRKVLGQPVSNPVLRITTDPPGGSLALLLSGDPGRTYVTETSPTLLGWSPVATNLTGLDGSVLITNSLPTDAALGFYRAHLAR